MPGRGSRQGASSWTSEALNGSLGLIDHKDETCRQSLLVAVMRMFVKPYSR